MKKIKLFMAVAVVTSLLGITSFAAVSTLQNGAKTIDSADIVVPINENAAILDDHIDNVAGTDTLGHIKIGDGLEMTGDSSDVANVKIGTGLQMTDGAVCAKIADDLETDDSEIALSAAMGVQLKTSLEDTNANLDDINSNLKGLGEVQIKMQIFDTSSTSGFYFTNSFYIPSGTTIQINNVNVFGASGNFSSEFQLSRYGNYLSFYTGNSSLAGKSCNFDIIISE